MNDTIFLKLQFSPSYGMLFSMFAEASCKMMLSIMVFGESIPGSQLYGEV